MVREYDNEYLSEVRGPELVLEDDSIVRERSVQTAAGASLVTPSLSKLWLNLCRVQLCIVSLHHHRRTRLDGGKRPRVYRVRLYIVEIDRSSSKAREGAQSFKSINHNLQRVRGYRAHVSWAADFGADLHSVGKWLTLLFWEVVFLNMQLQR